MLSIAKPNRYIAASVATIEIGTAAPKFTLPDQDGAKVTLAQLKGSWVVLYFYPKDDTPGCTKEACGLRDALPDFSKIDAEILGGNYHGHGPNEPGSDIRILAERMKDIMVEQQGVGLAGPQ